MAWTKPLVRQQAENIIRDAGIPFNQHAIIDSATKDRGLCWGTKRFFSCIPQTPFLGGSGLFGQNLA